MSERVFLNPGEWFFGGGDVRVETLLGSCVAMTLWSPHLRVGGMCHYLLPRRPARYKVRSLLDGRYGEDALFWLRRQALQVGIDMRLCEVKLFGGSRVLTGRPQGVGAGVGASNVQFAEQALAEAGVSLRCADVGGDGHRYLRFELNTGDVWVRHGDALPLTMAKQG